MTQRRLYPVCFVAIDYKSPASKSARDRGVSLDDPYFSVDTGMDVCTLADFSGFYLVHRNRILNPEAPIPTEDAAIMAARLLL